MRLNIHLAPKKGVLVDDTFLANQIIAEAKFKLMAKALESGKNAGDVIIEGSNTSKTNLKDALTPPKSDLFNNGS